MIDRFSLIGFQHINDHPWRFIVYGGVKLENHQNAKGAAPCHVHPKPLQDSFFVFCADFRFGNAVSRPSTASGGLKYLVLPCILFDLRFT